MSAYCHAGVTCKSMSTETYPVICVSKNTEFKIDIDLDLPCGLMMSIDPARPEFAIPFTNEDGQKVCAILADDVNTCRLSCPVTHAIATKGQFRMLSLLWPEGMSWNDKVDVRNYVEKHGLDLLTDPC